LDRAERERGTSQEEHLVPGTTSPLSAPDREVGSTHPSIRGRRIAGRLLDDRYLLSRHLGTGATATVYRAEDVLLRRRVAIKVLHEQFAHDDEVLRRFRREAEIASGLHHANIVSALDSGEWNGRHFLVLEHVDGRSLKTVVLEDAPLTPSSAIDLIRQLLNAVGYLHRRGIVHRDLKPENVIINSQGCLKLTDFGIARVCESDTTLSAEILGTARYMSPERAQGEQGGTASDQYALGVILYELLTGTVPFDAATAVGVLYKHVHGQAPRPSLINAAAPPALDAVVLRALAKNPRARFPDATTFIEALAGARNSVERGTASAWAMAA
jgi:serine/threonine-protein kinase